MNPINDLIKKNLVIKIPVWLLLAVPLVFYAGWEYYWYRHVGLLFIKWHTHLAVYLYLWATGAICFSVLGGSKPTERKKDFFLFFSSVLIALFFIELALLLTGGYRTLTEKVSGQYKSPYLPADAGHYHVYNKLSKEHWLAEPEFRFWRPTNSLGLADYEWVRGTTGKAKRIMALGDSFAEGDGAAFDSSYVAFLRRRLNSKGDSFYVMNGGVCGSDPFNNYLYLRDSLLAYKPDIIIQTMGSGDLSDDILLRGGMERFREDGTVKFCDPPWWEPIYAVSYAGRVFFDFAGYNEILLRGDMRPEVQKELNSKVTELFRQYGDLCSKNNARLVVVLFPCKYEVNQQKYGYNFSEILQQLRADKRILVVDLMPDYIAYMKKQHLSPDPYYWHTDMHHNAKGYQMMADCIYQNMVPVLTDTADAVK